MMRKELIIALVLICSSLALAATCGTGSTEGMIGYWKGENSANDSYNGYDGTLENGVVFGTGKVGDGFSFDANNDYVNLGDNDEFSFGDGTDDGAFSGEAWIKSSNYDAIYILAKNNWNVEREWGFSISTGEKLDFWVYDESTDSRIEIASSSSLTSYNNQWIHVAFTYDGSENPSGMKLYVNGQSVPFSVGFDESGYDAMENTNAEYVIGASIVSGSPTRVFNGVIDELALYDGVLNASEIEEHYLAGNNSGEGYCELIESGVIPEVSSKNMGLLAILTCALVILVVAFVKK